MSHFFFKVKGIVDFSNSNSTYQLIAARDYLAVRLSAFGGARIFKKYVYMFNYILSTRKGSR
jgi:hypothetical protein